MMLTDFEEHVIRYIIEHEAPELSSCLPELEVKERLHNGIGLYVNFSPKKTETLSSPKKATLGKSAYADIKGIEFGIGFMLYIEEGFPVMLEVFSHAGEEIPINILEFEFKYI